MFTRIMAPVDLAHVEKLGRALNCAADLAHHYRAPVTFVSVPAATPGEPAQTAEDLRERLEAFTKGMAETHGIEAASHAAIPADGSTELEAALLRAIDETGADLVVMATHVPDVADHDWPSNGGNLAQHATCSVMVVRP